MNSQAPIFPNAKTHRLIVCGMLVIGMLAVGAASVWAQEKISDSFVKDALPTAGIARNSVTNLHAENGRLWVGPRLNFTDNNGSSWNIAQIDSVLEGRGSVYSIDAEGGVIWVGLGFSERRLETDTVEPVAQGFAFSEDNGATWQFRFPPLDSPNDSLEVYGVSVLATLPVVTPVQSPPFDIDYDPASGTVWTAGWASGIRKSTDRGANWERVVLPPDNLAEIEPTTPYNFFFSPINRGVGRIGSENHKGFSVLVDENGTVWAGSSGGLNRSTDGGTAWEKFTFDGSYTAPLGNWITSIEEQPAAGINPVWATCWRALNADEAFGVVVTRDSGESFEQHLVGEKVYDFAFDGTTVYAAGDNGLFVTRDGGLTWASIRYFPDNEQPDRRIRPDARTFAVAVTEGAIWVGTEDGLLRSFDEGLTWTIFRAEIPVNPEEPSEEIPDVSTYAYPNPFSPLSDTWVRLRYELQSTSTVTIRIYDFAMNLVRELVSDVRAPGQREEIWDGKDDRGLRIANGVYFYTIGTEDGSFRGKILVLE